MTVGAHKIAIWQTLQNAFAFTMRERSDLMALATLPIIILAIAGAVTESLARTDGGVAPLQAGFVLINVLLGTALYTMFAVAWHRKYLVPGETSTVGAALKWGRRQFRFLGWLLAFGAVMSIPSLYLITSGSPTVASPGASGLGFVAVVASIALLPAYGRVLPMFPAVATDHNMHLAECWQMTAGNGWRLLWLSVLPFVPLVVLQVVLIGIVTAIAAAIGLEGSLSVTLLAVLIGQAIGYAGIAVAVSALSMAYKDLSAHN